VKWIWSISDSVHWYSSAILSSQASMGRHMLLSHWPSSSHFSARHCAQSRRRVWKSERASLFVCLFVLRVGVCTGACPGSPFALRMESIFAEFPKVLHWPSSSHFSARQCARSPRRVWKCEGASCNPRPFEDEDFASLLVKIVWCRGRQFGPLPPLFRRYCCRIATGPSWAIWKRKPC